VGARGTRDEDVDSIEAVVEQSVDAEDDLVEKRLM
jgi:hypothetical protein